MAEDSNLRRTFPIGEYLYWRANYRLAAIARPYTDPDLAWGGPRCTATHRAGGNEDGSGPNGGWQALGFGGKCRTAHHDGLFAKGKEYGSCRCRVSWRR